ncbi:FAD-dependent monooxygenase [Streptomyces kanamyceticus]|uniref:FAD-dependent monooxygenase n=1 Tax=Streptomyces kanamyceticus TaxID=1967 RepID=UPI0037DCCA83
MRRRDFGIHSPRRVVRVGDASHQADRYRVGRILLAGDAAHAFFPAGGQGLNVGLRDAVNLGWKLAASLDGWAPVHLLDTYESERRVAADEVMASTRAQNVLMTDFSSRAAALKAALGKLLALPEANRAVARSIAGLSDTCPQPPGDLAGNVHPSTGHRIPDLPLSASQPQASRLYQLLSDARFVLLHLDGVTHAPPTAPRCPHVHTATAPPAALPEPLRGATAALIRPDGHIAWVTDATTPSDVMEQARAALRRWCEPTADGAVP